MRKDASFACPCPGAPSRKRDRSNIGAAFFVLRRGIGGSEMLGTILVIILILLLIGALPAYCRSRNRMRLGGRSS